MDDTHLVLVGAMASGKSTIGRRLADRLGRPLRDSDDDLAAELGLSGRELAEREGVDALHRWEAEHLLRSLAGDLPAVVAAAASTVDDARCREAMAPHVVVWLDAPPTVLASRLAEANEDHRRDLAAGERDIAERRADAYRSAADIVVDVVAVTPDQAADAVVAELAARTRRPPTA